MAQQLDNRPVIETGPGARTGVVPRASVPALAMDGVARRFGLRWPLRGASLALEPGDGVALMGRNGSGKTTLLRIAAAALRPTRGSVRVLGRDVAEHPDAARAATGVLSHAPALYPDLTPRENLRFAQRMLGIDADLRAVDAALERVALSEVADERVRHFSSGMTRRVALARLLLRPYALLLLDEPYASFDADGIRLLDAIALEARARGAAVLVATHDPVRARGMADRAVVVEDGVVRDVPLTPSPSAAFEVVA